MLERGRNGIEELSRLMVLTLVPTIVEFLLVLGTLAYEFSLSYSLVVLVMWRPISATPTRPRNGASPSAGG